MTQSKPQDMKPWSYSEGTAAVHSAEYGGGAEGQDPLMKCSSLDAGDGKNCIDQAIPVSYDDNNV